MPVRVLGGHVAGLFVGEGLAAEVGLAVDLDVVEGAVGLGELVRVARVAVHVAVAVRGAAVGEEVHDLVGGFLMRREVVPEHGGVLEVGLRIAFLRVDEDGELAGVAEEEDGRVVEDPIPVALFRVEFEAEASGISRRVGRALFAADGGEASHAPRRFADFIEHVHGCLKKMGVLSDSCCCSDLGGTRNVPSR